MPTADEHLEQALREYNEKINAFEERGGSPQKLLDAYIHRGSVLYMMGSFVSAMTDFDEAISIIRLMEDSGVPVDPGYLVKAYTSRGMMAVDKSAEAMADDYRVAASRLGDLGDGSKFYDERDIVGMCLDCGCDLIDNEMEDEASPYVDKAVSLLVGKDDDWSRNRYMEVCGMEGEIHLGSEEGVKAAECFDETIRIGEDLMGRGSLEDVMELVSAYIHRGDLAEASGDDGLFLSVMDRAIAVMEELMEKGSLEDTELLSQLHGEVAQALMRANDMKTAEEHLMRQVAINLRGAEGYMESNGIRRGAYGSECDGDDE